MKKLVILGAILCSLVLNAEEKKATTFEVLIPTKEGTVDRELKGKEQLELIVASYNIAASRVSSPEEIGKAIKTMKADLVA